VTAWRQESDPLPVKIFVHWLQSPELIAAQFDGLGVAWEGWRPGDVLLQLHPLPADLAPGEYSLVTGLYDPRTLTRWPAAGLDTIPLGEMVIEAE
jgi:hypothetical protein